MNENEGFNYRAFLLRLWNEDQDAPWRLTLEHTHSGERHNFATVKQLSAYLETLMDHGRFPSGAADRDSPDPRTGA